MSFCEFCGYDVLGPCDNARLAERCQSLHSTCGFCGHNVYLTCDDAEKAERCRKLRGVTLAGAVGTDAPLGDAPQRGGRRTGDLRRRLPASLGALLGPLNVTGTGAQALGWSWAVCPGLRAHGTGRATARTGGQSGMDHTAGAV